MDENRQIAIVKIDSTNTDGYGKVFVESHKKIRSVKLEIADKSGRLYKFDYEFCGDGNFSGDFLIENPVLWSLSKPYLYDYRIKADFSDGKSFKKEGKIGFRSLGQNGKNITINGKPVYIRGYIRGAKAHDHANLLGLSLKDFYLKNLKEAKKFGFNYVRFHSVVPEEELFEAADEVGMLVHVELRPPHDIYNNLEEMVTTGSAIVPEEFLKETVDKCFNHPSFAVYCVGNEIKKASADDIRKIREKIDELDGTRLFLDTCAWGKNNRPNVDMDVQHLSYYFPYGKHAGMYDDTENLLAANVDENEPMKAETDNCEIVRDLHFNVPLIAHEVCHYTALRDFYSLKEKFIKSGAEKPWWVDEEIKLIEEKGYKEDFGEMFKASKHFQFICWKTAYEEMRKSSLLGGFHFLQFADTDAYENSNGVVDCFDDETCVKPEDFLKFNGDRVLIAELKTRNYFCADEITVPVYFSNLGEDTEKRANLAVSVEKDGKKYVDCSMKNVDVSRKGSYRLCKTKLTLPKEAGVYVLKIKLTTKSGVYSENEWTLWIYDRPAKQETYREFVSYENGNAAITDDIEKAFDLLEKGKKVCLVYRSGWTRHRSNVDMQNPKYAFKASWNRFKPVIWDRGTNFGGINDKNLLGKYGFPCEDYYDFNYGGLSEDCDKIILDDFPIKAKKIISGIDKSSRDRFDAYKDAYNLPELMPDRTLRDYAYLFEIKVGKGSLLVCGLNLTGLDENEPSAAAMSDFIKKYINSDDFNPENGMTLEELKAYMSESAKAPVKERTMTQFWELDDAPVESPEFWRAAKEYLK